MVDISPPQEIESDATRPAPGSNPSFVPKKLFNRNFILLWQGQTVSGIGTSLHQIALLYWLMETTGSATIMGLVSMAAALPGVILGPFGGAIADRYSRKKLIVWGDAILGVGLLSLAVPFLLLDSRDIQIAWLVGVSILIGIVGAFFRPAVMAALPNLVPLHRLHSANALNSVSMTASMAFGQALGGVLYRLTGAMGLFFINGISYLVSAISEIFIDIPQTFPNRPGSWRELCRAFLDDIVEGLRYVWRNKGFRNLIVAMGLVTFVTAPLSVLMPILLSKYLNLQPDWFGYLMAAMGVGNLLGMALAGVMPIDGRSRFFWCIGALFGMGASNLVLGMADQVHWLLAANFTAGLLLGVMMVTFTTLIQVTTPEHLRGRVSSVMVTFMTGAAPFAMGLAGVLADLVDQNIPLLFICSGLAAMSFVMMLGFNRSFRDFMGARVNVKVRRINPT